MKKLPFKSNLLNVLHFVRRQSLRIKHVNVPFTIVCNNCWGGYVYRWFGLPYSSPTIGLYFFAEDYLKFVSNLRYYINLELKFINLDDSKYKETLIKRGGKDVACPIGVLGDIEIIFLHYRDSTEAKEKWERRCQRINWDNIYYKFSQMNHCSVEFLREFDQLPMSNKFVFVSRDYNLESQVIADEFVNNDEITNDTKYYNKHINIVRWLAGDKNFRK